MRSKHSCVLTMILVGALPVLGQTPEAAPPPVPVPQATPPQAAPPPALPPQAAPPLAPAPIAAPFMAAPITDPLQPPPPYGYPPGIPGWGTPPGAAPDVYWLHADYVAWFMRSDKTLPYITELTPGPGGGAPYTPTTLFPNNQQVGYNALSGVRLDTGVWFDSDHCYGLDASGFGTGISSRSAFFASNGAGSPILARQYTDASTGQPSAILFSNSNPSASYPGSIGASSTLGQIYNGDISFRYSGATIFTDNTDYLAGFRYFHFDETVNLYGNSTLPGGTQLSVADTFKVDNNFYGGQVGIAGRWVWMYGFSFDATFKFAMGDMNERVEISGSNTLTPPGGPPSTQATGLYAQASNIGTHTQDKFTVIPEFNFNLNYNLTHYAAVYIGYNMIYVSEISRAAAAIDPSVNSSTLRYLGNPTSGNAPGPTFNFKNQDLFLQGLDVGVRFEF